MAQSNILGQVLIHALGAASQQAVELAKIKGSTAYIKLIRSLREIMLSLIGMSACLVFAACSLVIFHVMVLLYAPLSLIVRIWITSIALCIYLSVALIYFSWLYSERQWFRKFKGDEILCEIRGVRSLVGGFFLT